MEKTKNIMGTKIAVKAYEIDLSKIEEGFLYSPVIVYAESISKARAALLDKIRYDGMVLRSNEELSYINIPVKRAPQFDLREFEGKHLTETDIQGIIRKRDRDAKLDSVLNDESITHCYIRKHGSYYMPNACGYTQLKRLAGIYTKEDAVSHGKSCDELHVIPINKAEHNSMIVESIADLETRLIL
jgi:hypothetical protein